MKRLILSISIFIFLFVMTGNVIANSANPYFTGSNSAGVVITGEDSVIEVLKEDLTLYIDGSENSSVSAKYTMKNTTDLNVRARMLFPFSDENDYKYIPDFTPNYSISKNGSILEYEKRLGYGNF